MGLTLPHCTLCSYFTVPLLVHTWSYWALLGPIQSYWALLGPIQPYWALLSLTVSFIAFADERMYVHYDLLGCFRSQKYFLCPGLMQDSPSPSRG